MRTVLAFAAGVLLSVVAYVAARLFAIFVWQIGPNNLVGETLLAIASGAGMGLATIFVPAWVMDAHEQNRVSLACFVCVGTIVALASFFALLSIYAGAPTQSGPLILGSASIALPLGFFGAGVTALKS